MRHITLAFLFISTSLFAQEEKTWRTIPSVTEWLEEINNWPDSVYRQENLEILFDHEKDKGLVATNRDEVASTGGDPIYIVNKRVDVDGFLVRTNLVIGGGVRWFANIQFNGFFRLSGSIDNRIGFVNCHFKDGFIYANVRGRQALNLRDCTLEEYLFIRNPQISWITMDGLLIKEGLRIESWEQPFTVIIRDSNIKTISMEGSLSNVSMIDSQIGRGIQINCTVLQEFVLRNSNVPAIEIEGAVLPTKNTYIPFDSIENKLCINLRSQNWNRDPNHIPYRASTKEEIADRVQFDQLIAGYYVLLDVYKARGDMNSYNACYVEMRDKLTARSKLLYDEEPSFANFFAFKINRFTRAFSDYGTKPEKAIIVFFQVVLAFSIFYFFFPSTWNTTNSEKLMKRLSNLGGYFTSKEGLSDLFEKETKDRYMTYNEFKQFMSERENELPFYFQALSKPLYRVTTARFNWTKGILSKAEILNGKWSDLPARRKTITSLIIGLYLMIYLIWVLLIRCLNAITLSLNAFSTLGFGEIPTRGLARYVTIVQGFVGWFLLSIFLVSLIGQILN